MELLLQADVTRERRDVTHNNQINENVSIIDILLYVYRERNPEHRINEEEILRNIVIRVLIVVGRGRDVVLFDMSSSC